MKLTNVLISLLSSSAERIMRNASDATIDESFSSPLVQMIMPDKLDTVRGRMGIFREFPSGEQSLTKDKTGWGGIEEGSKIEGDAKEPFLVVEWISCTLPLCWNLFWTLLAQKQTSITFRYWGSGKRLAPFKNSPGQETSQSPAPDCLSPHLHVCLQSSEDPFSRTLTVCWPKTSPVPCHVGSL